MLKNAKFVQIVTKEPGCGYNKDDLKMKNNTNLNNEPLVECKYNVLLNLVIDFGKIVDYLPKIYTQCYDT